MKKVYLAVMMVFAMSSAAQALLLTPGDEVDSGIQTSQSEIDTYLFNTYGLTSFLYKAEGSESGAFADDYTTVFDPPGDPEDALVTWDGPDFITDPSYLLVKDGNQDPAWYLFDISSWDGMEELDLQNFWPIQGAISHVSIYGGGEPPPNGEIPEPATMLLFGAGLAGLAGVRRRRNK